MSYLEKQRKLQTMMYTRNGKRYTAQRYNTTTGKEALDGLAYESASTRVHRTRASGAQTSPARAAPRKGTAPHWSTMRVGPDCLCR